LLPSAAEFTLRRAVGGPVLPALPDEDDPDLAPALWLRRAGALGIGGCVALAAGLALMTVTQKKV